MSLHIHQLFSMNILINLHQIQGKDKNSQHKNLYFNSFMMSLTNTVSGALCHLGSWHRALPPTLQIWLFVAIIYQLLKIMILLVEMLCLPTKVSDIFDRNITIWINFIWEKFQAAWPPVIKSHQLLLLLKFANFQYLCQNLFVYLDFHKD